LVAALHRWVDVLLTSAESTRYQLAEVAQALGRLGAPESLPALLRLLDEDLARRRRAMEEMHAAQVRRAVVDMSDARMSYVGQYGGAFIAIGGEAAAAAMISYIRLGASRFSPSGC
jgi:HEAT repeat protein